MGRIEDIERVEVESPESVARMLRGVAHPARVVIRESLAADHGEFSVLVERTKLSKNALVNHLNQLIDLDLVRRVLRVEYALTSDGMSLIRAAASAYRCWVRRQQMAEEAIRRYIMRSDEGSKMGKKVIHMPAKFRSSWTSYCGAMSGELEAGERETGAALLRRAYELESTAVDPLSDAMRALS